MPKKPKEKKKLVDLDLKRINTVVKRSGKRYSNASHFIRVAVDELLRKEETQQKLNGK